MEYINTETGQYPLTEYEIKAAHPYTSFTAPFVPGEPYSAVFPSPLPAHDPVTQVPRRIAPELTAKGHWEQRWEIVPLGPDLIETNRLAAAAQARAAAKSAREAAVAAIKVTTASGKEFDGDETSQGRMARAIVGMQAAGADSITWVLADNTPSTVTLAELTEALVLAGQAQAALWVIA